MKKASIYLVICCRDPETGSFVSELEIVGYLKYAIAKQKSRVCKHRCPPKKYKVENSRNNSSNVTGSADMIALRVWRIVATGWTKLLVTMISKCHHNPVIALMPRASFRCNLCIISCRCEIVRDIWRHRVKKVKAIHVCSENFCN